MKSLLKTINAVIFYFFILTIPSLIVCIIILEVLVRVVMPVSDIPDTLFDPVLGNHFIPNQEGVLIKGKRSEIHSKYRINSNGWNSPYEYINEKLPSTFRIAVIGDSYVEAFQVDYDKSYPYLMENRLKEKLWKPEIEVYSFGHSGANLVQYLTVLRNIAPQYSPDLVVINIIHNDFKESLYGYGRKDNWMLSFTDGHFAEMMPRPVSNLSFKRFIRKFALVRYLVVNLNLFKTSKIIKRLFYAETRRYEANVNTKDLDIFANREFLKQMLEYVFKEYAAVAREYDFKLLLVMDTNRQPIYNGDDPKTTRVYMLNKATAEVTERLGIPFIDLTETFQETWKAKGKRIEHDVDGHWNSLGHSVVADRVCKWIISNKLIL